VACKGIGTIKTKPDPVNQSYAYLLDSILLSHISYTT
jgi:hypothetical protein